MDAPRCLLGFFDLASEGDLDPADLQAWFEWEVEAFRYGVGPDVPLSSPPEDHLLLCCPLFRASLL
jgi:hypothetical protein